MPSLTCEGRPAEVAVAGINAHPNCGADDDDEHDCWKGGHDRGIGTHGCPLESGAKDRPYLHPLFAEGGPEA